MVKLKARKNTLTVTRGNKAYDMTRGISKREKDLRAAKYGLASVPLPQQANSLVSVFEIESLSRKSWRGGM